MGRKIKNEGLILKCEKTKTIEDIQSQIQNKMGQDYEIIKPTLQRNRVKVLYVDEREHKLEEDIIISKIIKQNNLDNYKAEIKIIRKTKIFNKTFNLILEMDEGSFEKVTEAKRLYIGWCSCKIVNDFNIIRCFKCCRYGHIEKECIGEICCPLCGEKHAKDECRSKSHKCVNYIIANEKFNLKLKVNHCVWSMECDSLSRIIEQRSKFINSEIIA